MLLENPLKNGRFGPAETFVRSTLPGMLGMSSFLTRANRDI
jgi:hypothetical protein